MQHRPAELGDQRTHRGRAIRKGAAQIEDGWPSANGCMDVALPAGSAEEVTAGRCMHVAHFELVKANAAGLLQMMCTGYQELQQDIIVLLAEVLIAEVLNSSQMQVHGSIARIWAILDILSA